MNEIKKLEKQIINCQKRIKKIKTKIAETKSAILDLKIWRPLVIKEEKIANADKLLKSAFGKKPFPIPFEVFLNGLLQTEGDDFMVHDSGRIDFSGGMKLEMCDRVSVRDKGQTNQRNIDINRTEDTWIFLRRIL